MDSPLLSVRQWVGFEQNSSYYIFPGSLQSTGGNKVRFSRDGSADCTAKGKATVDIKKPPCYPVTELRSQKSQKSPSQTNRHICQQLLLIFWNYPIDHFIAKKKKRYLWWWLKSLEIPSQILSGVNWSCSSESRGHCQFTQVELAL